MKHGFIIRDPATGLCWTQSATWGDDKIAKIYRSKGRAKAAIANHRCKRWIGPMNRAVDIIAVELTVGEVETVPAVQMDE